MDHDVDVVVVENALEGIAIEDRCLIEREAIALGALFETRDAAHTLDGHFARVAQIVDDNNVVAACKQLNDRINPAPPVTSTVVSFGPFARPLFAM